MEQQSTDMRRLMQTVTSSLHFWWLAFLRSSPDYWWICQQKGDCQDARLVKVWEDFGDVFDCPCLMQWWQAKAAKLFDSPQMEMALGLPPSVTLGLEILGSKDLITAWPEMICMAIPLCLDPSTACAAFLEVWENARCRGTHYNQDAKYQLHTLDLKAKRTIIPAYQALTLNQCVNQSQHTDRFHEWGCYEMGMHLNLAPQHRPHLRDNVETAKRKQKTTRALFCQSKKAAAELIANVEIGKFPCKAPVESKPRWTPTQQRDMTQALNDGAWRSHNWLSLEHNFMLPDRTPELPLYPAGDQRNILNTLASFNQLETPFLESKRKKALR